MKYQFLLTTILFALLTTLSTRAAQAQDSLSTQQQSLVAIAASTAKGNLKNLDVCLNKGLDAGLPVNSIKEAIIHVYAYAGFPRSIRGLQTMMATIEQRKANGIEDQLGDQATPIDSNISRYDRGKAILEQLTGVAEKETKTGYAAFAPTIEVFLKEHLFADLFERDVLSYQERELVTVSVLSAIGGVEPMLHSHLTICLNIGLTSSQLSHFVDVIEKQVGKDEAASASKVLKDVLRKQR